jgi:flagellar protein FliO/FliZ
MRIEDCGLRCIGLARAHATAPHPPLDPQSAFRNPMKPLLPLLALLPVATHAQPAAPAPAGPSLLPMLLVLGLVLALIPVSMWLLKRLGAGSPASAAGLKVVGQLPLGARERLVVVEAGERWLVLGVTASNINRIGTLPKGELPAGPAAGGGFAQLLSAARRSHDR